jgi:hypothetical protein
VATLVQGVPHATGFVALLSVALTPTSGVAHAAAFTQQEGSALAAQRLLPVLACGPSPWADEGPSAPKVRGMSVTRGRALRSTVADAALARSLPRLR